MTETLNLAITADTNLNDIETALRDAHQDVFRLPAASQAFDGGVWVDEHTAAAWIALPSMGNPEIYEIIETTASALAEMDQLTIAAEEFDDDDIRDEVAQLDVIAATVTARAKLDEAEMLTPANLASLIDKGLQGTIDRFDALAERARRARATALGEAIRAEQTRLINDGRSTASAIGTIAEATGLTYQQIRRTTGI